MGVFEALPHVFFLIMHRLKITPNLECKDFGKCMSYYIKLLNPAYHSKSQQLVYESLVSKMPYTSV